ncbi:hypothetical protein A2U01_0051636 [Trifolium medium]|uniref:Uncharacterized protein n=1 Tax=Trifolium medium TaxID=97028 RepID=A0A392R2F3_9FABA|nr:hypothetical protein [Trifolium medium]
MKVSLEELEAGLAELDMKEEKPCPDLDMTNIKKEDLWVRRWGRFRKVAVRSKFGVNKIEVKNIYPKVEHLSRGHYLPYSSHCLSNFHAFSSNHLSVLCIKV